MTYIIDGFLSPLAEENLTNAEILKQLWAVAPQSLDTYLIGLAAVQRGLQVVFYGDSLNARGAIGGGGSRKSALPMLLTISDYRKTYFFTGSGGASTSKKMHALSRHKGASKALFLQNNVPTPNGYMASKSSLSKLADFLRSSQSNAFVVKPIDGSLGKGVLIGLTKTEVMAHVTKRGGQLTIVEELAKGREYRVFVVGERVVAAYEWQGLYVIGDGRSTVAQLIAERNRRRAQNLDLRSSPINSIFAGQFLLKSGLSLFHIPSFGEKIVLRNANTVNAVGTSCDVTLTLPKPVALTAIAACKALGIPTAGLDIVNTDTGPSVLELNALPHITAHSFPYEGSGSGNAAAEALVDFYFAQYRKPRDLSVAIDGAALMAAFADNGIKTIMPAPLISV